MGGGLCYNGGWLPPGMFVRTSGTVHYFTLLNGSRVWYITVGSVLYEPVGGLAASYRVNGMVVKFTAVNASGTRMIPGSTLIQIVSIAAAGNP